jgi:ketosteroid isomerase-like protein
MRSGKRINISIILMLFLVLVPFSACNTTDSKSAAAVSVALSLAEKYTGAWIDKDPDTLSSLLSDDVIGFDAQEAGWSYNKQQSEEMLRDPAWWDQFQINKGTIFSSPDGKFVAVSTTMDFWGADPERVPNAHIIALKANQVVFSYDYYGGSISDTEPLPVFEPSTVEPGSAVAQKLVKRASETVRKWQKAYNDRDAEAYLSCFAEDAEYIDLTSSSWRIMTKAELTEDIASRFSRNTFESKLKASTTSPITDGFFVSADGHYAAAQGTYADKGIKSTNMVVILEIEAGKIVKLYNFMLVDRSLLQP